MDDKNKEKKSIVNMKDFEYEKTMWGLFYKEIEINSLIPQSPVNKYNLIIKYIML